MFNNNYLNTSEAAVLLGISLSSLYKKIANYQIPCYRFDGSNRLRFKTDELLAWMDTHCRRVKTVEEIEREAKHKMKEKL